VVVDPKGKNAEDDDVRRCQVADVDTEGMDKSPALNAAGAESKDSMCDSVKCCICLNPFDKQTVGSLENCQHVFCLECILQWSQTANTCPVDRISFAFIHQRPSPGVPVCAEESSAAVICEECGRGDRRHRLLVCVLCDSGYEFKYFDSICRDSPPCDTFWMSPLILQTSHCLPCKVHTPSDQSTRFLLLHPLCN
uniref:RING-type domain-containing protein n=1 Tax=Amphilophus citrinellus TaxID=61819 RepID=A0A3Q0S9W1_AMPCI